MNLREKFTKWYVRKSYRIGYVDSDLVYVCPGWVKLLAYFFFSPSVYYAEKGVKYV